MPVHIFNEKKEVYNLMMLQSSKIPSSSIEHESNLTYSHKQIFGTP
jgi:hypothetical protein